MAADARSRRAAVGSDWLRLCATRWKSAAKEAGWNCGPIPKRLRVPSDSDDQRGFNGFELAEC